MIAYASESPNAWEFFAFGVKSNDAQCSLLLLYSKITSNGAKNIIWDVQDCIPVGCLQGKKTPFLLNYHSTPTSKNLNYSYV